MFSSFTKSFSPKSYLASQIATSLSVYFEVEPHQIESNLVSNSKIVLRNVRLRPYSLGSNYTLGGTVNVVEFSWSWGGLGSSGFITNATLTIDGVEVCARLAKKGGTPEVKHGETHSASSPVSMEESSPQPPLGTYVQQIVDHMTLSVSNVKISMELPSFSGGGDVLNSSDLIPQSMVFEIGCIELLVLGRLGQGNSTTTEKRKAAEANQQNVPLMQRISFNSISSHIVAAKTVGEEKESITIPLIDPFSYRAKVNRVSGERFVGGIANGLEVVGETMMDGRGSTTTLTGISAVVTDEALLSNKVTFHLGKEQMVAIRRLQDAMTSISSSSSSESPDSENASKTGDTFQSQEHASEKSIFSLPFESLSAVFDTNDTKFELPKVTFTYRTDGKLFDIKGNNGITINDVQVLDFVDGSQWRVNLIGSKLSVRNNNNKSIPAIKHPPSDSQENKVAVDSTAATIIGSTPDVISLTLTQAQINAIMEGLMDLKAGEVGSIGKSQAREGKDTVADAADIFPFAVDILGNITLHLQDKNTSWLKLKICQPSFSSSQIDAGKQCKIQPYGFQCQGMSLGPFSHGDFMVRVPPIELKPGDTSLCMNKEKLDVYVESLVLLQDFQLFVINMMDALPSSADYDTVEESTEQNSSRSFPIAIKTGKMNFAVKHPNMKLSIEKTRIDITGADFDQDTLVHLQDENGTWMNICVRSAKVIFPINNTNHPKDQIIPFGFRCNGVHVKSSCGDDFMVKVSPFDVKPGSKFLQIAEVASSIDSAEVVQQLKDFAMGMMDSLSLSKTVQPSTKNSSGFFVPIEFQKVIFTLKKPKIKVSADKLCIISDTKVKLGGNAVLYMEDENGTWLKTWVKTPTFSYSSKDLIGNEIIPFGFECSGISICSSCGGQSVLQVSPFKVKAGSKSLQIDTLTGSMESIGIVHILHNFSTNMMDFLSKEPESTDSGSIGLPIPIEVGKVMFTMIQPKVKLSVEKVHLIGTNFACGKDLIVYLEDESGTWVKTWVKTPTISYLNNEIVPFSFQCNGMNMGSSCGGQFAVQVSEFEFKPGCKCLNIAELATSVDSLAIAQSLQKFASNMMDSMPMSDNTESSQHTPSGFYVPIDIGKVSVNLKQPKIKLSIENANITGTKIGCNGNSIVYMEDENSTWIKVCIKSPVISYTLPCKEITSLGFHCSGVNMGSSCGGNFQISPFEFKPGNESLQIDELTASMCSLADGKTLQTFATNMMGSLPLGDTNPAQGTSNGGAFIPFILNKVTFTTNGPKMKLGIDHIKIEGVGARCKGDATIMIEDESGIWVKAWIKSPAISYVNHCLGDESVHFDFRCCGVTVASSFENQFDLGISSFELKPGSKSCRIAELGVSVESFAVVQDLQTFANTIMNMMPSNNNAESSSIGSSLPIIEIEKIGIKMKDPKILLNISSVYIFQTEVYSDREVILLVEDKIGTFVKTVIKSPKMSLSPQYSSDCLIPFGFQCSGVDIGSSVQSHLIVQLSPFDLGPGCTSFSINDTAVSVTSLAIAKSLQQFILEVMVRIPSDKTTSKGSFGSVTLSSLSVELVDPKLDLMFDCVHISEKNLSFNELGVHVEDKAGCWIQAKVKSTWLKHTETVFNSDNAMLSYRLNCRGVNMDSTSFGKANAQVSSIELKNGALQISGATFNTESQSVAQNIQLFASQISESLVPKDTESATSSINLPVSLSKLHVKMADPKLTLVADNIHFAGDLRIASVLSTDDSIVSAFLRDIHVSMSHSIRSNIGMIESLHIPDTLTLSKPIENLKLVFENNMLRINVEDSVKVEMCNNASKDRTNNKKCSHAEPSTLAPFPIQFYSREIMVTTVQDKKNCIILKETQCEARPNVKSPQSETQFNITHMGEIEINKFLQIRDLKASACLHGDSANIIRNLAVVIKSISVNPEFSQVEWSKMMRKAEEDSKSSVMMCPHAKMSSFVLSISYKGKFLSAAETELLIDSYNGTASTDTGDIIKHLTGAISGRLPKILSNLSVGGTNVVDMAASTLGGRVFSGRKNGVLAVTSGSLTGIVMADGVRGAIDAGKSSRGVSEAERYKFGDISRGVASSISQASKSGAENRRGNSASYRPGDITSGVASGASSYLGNNKSRLGGVAGSGIGMSVGAAIAGPIGLVAGSLLGSSAAKRAMNDDQKEKTRNDEELLLVFDNIKPTSGNEKKSTQVQQADDTNNQRTQAQSVVGEHKQQANSPGLRTRSLRTQHAQHPGSSRSEDQAAGGRQYNQQIRQGTHAISMVGQQPQRSKYLGENNQSMRIQHAQPSRNPRSLEQQGSGYQFGDLTKSIVQEGKKERGAEANTGYRFGDFSRGLLRKAKGGD